MSFSDTPARLSARPSPFPSNSALVDGANPWLRFAIFAILHLVLLAALYGAAVVKARSHDPADAYGAGQVVHLGRMALYPVSGKEAQP